MTRVADDILAVHLEVALATAAPSLLDGLAASDARQRRVAVGEIARHLAQRLRCFDIRSDDAAVPMEGQRPLFPTDLGPMGQDFSSAVQR